MNPLFMKNLKKLLATATLVGSSLTSNAQFLDLLQYVNNDNRDYFFGADITNNTGVELTSATIDYSQLLLDTANLDWNIGKYDGLNGGTVDGYVTLSEFLPKAIDDTDVFFRLATTGDVHRGWTGNIGTDGIVDITNNGLFPGLTYDRWNSGDDMHTGLGIDNSLYRDPDNGGMVIGLSLNNDKDIDEFVTTSAGFGSVPRTVSGYSVNFPSSTSVPEPHTYGALAGLGALGYSLARRKPQKNKK